MKSGLTNQTPTALFLLTIMALTMVTATTTPAADKKSTPNAPPTIDPATGLPRPFPWKDPEWKDPDKILPNVNYDGLPLGEVVRLLRDEFKGAFDVLVPNTWRDPGNPSLSVDPQSTTVRMQLKNVTASEVFNAMNLMFEAENEPYRWELRLNGNRPTAMLRVLPELIPAVAVPPPPPKPLRMIYFVGDLLGDEKSGGMTMERLVKTISEVYEMSYGKSQGVLQFHKEAQLLIVTGSRDEIAFAQNTLVALRERPRAQHEPKSAVPKAKTDETKPQ